MSLAAIGEKVGLSSPAVKRRVDRLEERGIIRGYTAVVDQAAIDAGTEAFVELYCQGDTSLQTLRDGVASYDEVVGAYTVAGDPDAILHLRARDIQHLEETLERLHAEPNVERTRTQMILTRLAERRRRL